MTGTLRSFLSGSTGSPRRTTRPLFVRLCVVAAACLLLTAGCALQTAPAPPDSRVDLYAADTPEAFWRIIRQPGVKFRPQNMTAHASLYVSEGHKSARMRLDLWGSTALPLRLDLRSSIGSPLAYAREDKAAWTIFYPDSNRAYSHTDARRALPALDLPLPFSLRDMALLLTGHGFRLLTTAYQTATPLQAGGWTYTFATGPIQQADFDPAGNITRLQSATPEGWIMELSRYGENEFPLSPGKIVLSMAQDKTARIFLKSLAIRRQPWPDNATALNLPQEVDPIPLDGRPSLY